MQAMAAGRFAAQRAVLARAARSPGGTLWILGNAGAAGKVRWRPGDQVAAAQARSMFDRLCSHGYRAFAIGPTRPARCILHFDAASTQLMLVPGPATGWDDCDAAAWTASIDEAGSLLRSWVGALLSKPAAGMQQPRRDSQLRASREALAVLLRVLSPRQRQSLRESGCFMLVGGASGLRYRVRSEGAANIEQLDAHGDVAYRLRIAPACELALPGWLAMQALHLQDPETEYPFLSAAQVFPAKG